MIKILNWFHIFISLYLVWSSKTRRKWEIFIYTKWLIWIIHHSFNSYFLWIYCFASRRMISLLIFNSKIWAQITNEFLEFSLIGNVKCPNVSKLAPCWLMKCLPTYVASGGHCDQNHRPLWNIHRRWIVYAAAINPQVAHGVCVMYAGVNCSAKIHLGTV